MLGWCIHVYGLVKVVKKVDMNKDIIALFYVGLVWQVLVSCGFIRN